MPTKIYVSGNYLSIDNGVKHKYVPLSVARFFKNGSSFTIKDRDDVNGISIDFSEIQKENGSAYSSESEFLDFLKNHTGFSAGGGNGQGVTTKQNGLLLVSSEDASVFADGDYGKKDQNGLEGWNFTNSSNPYNKINWYFINNYNIDSDTTLGDIKGMYAIATIYNTQEFYFQIYTKRKNDGQDVSWYRSRLNFLTLGAFTGYVGQRVLVYWGEEPTFLPAMTRIEMTLDLLSSNGLQESDEEIFLGGLTTSTNYPSGSYSFTIGGFGYKNNDVLTHLPLIKKFDDTLINSQISSLQSYLNAVESGRFFRGYVADASEMNALSSPVEHQYVARVDTETIWEYNGVLWADTLITASLTGISEQEEASSGYSNTHYIDLDGTNDYVEFDSGVDVDVLDYTKSWSLGIEIENVSQINDSSYTTLWKRGNNEITLRKGNGNWGVYFYADGQSIAQSNTMVVPEQGSKLFFVCDSGFVKYYITTPSNNGSYYTIMYMNPMNVANYNNASGHLAFGQGGVIGSNWFGGINNAMIMEGSSANLNSSDLSEYFGSQDVTLMSFYDEIEDFIPLGEAVYPAVEGTKGVVSGNLINGTASDFVQR